MDKQTVTIYDVAREAGVSMATVSRVVNGNPNVKASTREKVLDVIERLDYRPNAIARGLASKQTTTVGVVVPDITNIYFATLARGIDDVATMYEYNIVLANTDESAEKEVQVLNTLLAKQVDGLLVMAESLSDNLRHELKRIRVPVVLTGTIDPDQDFHYVSIDNVEASEEATNLLLKQGLDKVAFLSANADVPMNHKRLEGIRNAHVEAGKTFDDNLIYNITENEDFGQLAKTIIANGVQAAVVSQDEISIRLMNALVDEGVKVPDDFQIISSEGSKLGTLVKPQITAIQPPIYDIGAVSMRLLTKLMKKEENIEEFVTLPYDILKRDSTL